MKTEDIAQLKTLIESDKSKQWYTIKEMAKMTGETESNIAEIVTTDDDFLRSTYFSNDNLALFTTRKDFNENGSFISKMLGAFKNRID